MRFAVPIANGMLAMHFGHCEQFALIDVDDCNNIIRTTLVVPPPHQPGVLPKWLAENGANVIIAGGMGMRAQNLFAENNISVVVGAPAENAEAVVSSYLAGTLVTGNNICDH